MVTSQAIARVAVVLAAGVALGAQAPTPQQTPPVFRTGTTVVPLTVTVLDRKGAPVRDLTQADFTVFENKRLREIVNRSYPAPDQGARRRDRTGSQAAAAAG